jgi:hypothetical protein
MHPPWADEIHLLTPAVPSVGAVPVVWAFPNTYTVGITSLGYQWIWGMLAQRTDVRVSRWFTDGGESLPEPPELVGFSCGWELDYPHLFDLWSNSTFPYLVSTGKITILWCLGVDRY